MVHNLAKLCSKYCINRVKNRQFVVVKRSILKLNAIFIANTTVLDDAANLSHLNAPRGNAVSAYNH